MSEPTTAAGRALLVPLLAGDALAGDVRRAVEQIEAEARAELRAELAAKVEALDWSARGLAYSGFTECRARVLALLSPTEAK